MNDDVTITSEGIEIQASETVSTGDYETADVGAVLEASAEGVDLSEGIPDEFRKSLYGLQRSLQGVARAAADERKQQSKEEQ